jgi:alkanesulfonate monooxygenase SsuD/methylene tetrahydromethanopterin reductase-like flavin-dependent oxidoreductase (luciferase family)
MTGGVRFGLVVNPQHPPGVGLRDHVEDQLRFVHQARDDGWHALMFGQHYIATGLQQLQSLPLAARLVPESGDMELIFGIVLAALANPVDLAESYASLDILSGGRLVFGVGLGYRQAEYDAFGVDRADGVRRLEANLDLVKRLWSGEPVSCALPWCRLDEVSLTVLPEQRPRPQIVMAANNDLAVARAARLADTWLINPHANIGTIQRQLALFYETRRAVGQPPPASCPVIREAVCAPTRSEAIELAHRYLGAKYESYAAWGQDKALPEQDDVRRPCTDLGKGRFVVGTPDDCIEQLTPWRDELGCDDFMFRLHWSEMPTGPALRSQRLLIRDVLPALRRA